MGEKIDIGELKRNTDIVQVIGRYVPLKQDGIHWVCKCPFHSDKTGSLKVTPSKNIFKCFGCGVHGDVFDFVMKFTGKDMKDAIKEVADPNNTAATPYSGSLNESMKKESEKPKWEQIIPGVKMDGMHHHYKHGTPSHVWEYFTAENRLIGCVCRFDLPDGSKEVLPLIYATNGKSTKWIYKGFDKPRPLYNLPKLYKNPLAPVLVVEGEKTANAAEELFPKAVVITWMGGVQGAKHADWTPLKDRVVVLWPDNDQPGFDAMHFICEQVKDFADSVKWVLNPTDAEKGWDVADAEWTAEEAQEYSKTNIIQYPGSAFRYDTKGHINEIEWDLSAIHKKDPEQKSKKTSEKKASNEPLNNGVSNAVNPPIDDNDPNGFPLYGTQYFRMLGAQKEGNGMVFYFYAFSSKTVIGLSPSAMTKNNLLQLAPLNWWKNTFVDSKQDFSVASAANYLINKSSEFGSFSDKWLRGRGAWIDNKRVIIHAGDKLLINGVETSLKDYKSKYIYEVGEELGFTVEKPLSNKDAIKFIDLLKLLNWDRPINSYLLAGWCVVAPVCGALDWRPHVWLTGAAGTGKTYVFKHIVRAMLGETGLAVQGETSEAGLRQTLGHDALPVVFDEAEGEDLKSQQRMQSVLALARASSANDGGLMAKGSAGGSAKTFRIRSCFAFASIAVQLQQQSDRTRWSVLGLKRATDVDAPARWKQFQQQYTELITDEYCERLRARTVSILPVILSNIKTFTSAAAATIGEQRSGDQVGVLLAGAYSLVSDKVITYKEAVEWVESKDWDEEKGLSSTRDEIALLSHLLEYIVRIETQHATVERSIGELVLIAMGLKSAEWHITSEQANDRLKRTGMKVKDDYLFVSNSDRNILQILNGTSWAKNHHKILLRLENTLSINSERFASGVSTRAVRIEKDTLFKDFVPEIVVQPTSPMDAANELLKPSNDVFAQPDTTLF